MIEKEFPIEWDSSIETSEKLYITGDDEILINGDIKPQELTAKEWIEQIIIQAKRELQELKNFSKKAITIDNEIKIIRREIRTNKKHYEYERRKKDKKIRKIEVLKEDYLFYTTRKNILAKEIKRECYELIKSILKDDFKYLSSIKQSNNYINYAELTEHIMHMNDLIYIRLNQKQNKEMEKYHFLISNNK